MKHLAPSMLYPPTGSRLVGGRTVTNPGKTRDAGDYSGHHRWDEHYNEWIYRRRPILVQFSTVKATFVRCEEGKWAVLVA